MKRDFNYNEYDENQVDKLFKKKKKKKLKRKVKILTFLFCIVIIIAYFVSDLSKVKSIEVIGNKEVSSKLIEEASAINNKTIFLLMNKGKIEENIKELALIKKANVSFDLLGNVTIEIEESKKVAYCVIENKTYVVDELGKVVETTDPNVKETLKSCPRLSDFVSLDFLKEFSKEYAKVPELIKTLTSDIVYSPLTADESRVIFILDNGKKLIVRVEDMADELMRFPYEAYMVSYQNKCEFDFSGDFIYMRDCKTEDNHTDDRDEITQVPNDGEVPDDSTHQNENNQDVNDSGNQENINNDEGVTNE